MDDNKNSKEVAKRQPFFKKRKDESSNDRNSDKEERTSVIQDIPQDFIEGTPEDSIYYVDPDYELDYQAYVDMFSSPYSEPGVKPMSFEDWKRINYSVNLSNPANIAKLGFLPGAGIAGGNIAGKVTSTIAGAVIDAASSYAMDKLNESVHLEDMPQIKSAFNDYVRHVGDHIKSTVSQTGSDNSEGGGPPNLPSSSSSSRPGHNAAILNLNPRPAEITLDTGIASKAYGQYFIDARYEFSPLHITHAKLSPAQMSTSSKLNGFFSNVLVIIFQLAAQANMSFNVNAANTFSRDNIIYYLETISNALQIYYFYTSVITYEQSGGRNEGMLKLRQLITADDVDLLYQMGRLLRQFPIPPNLKELIFYMSQTYASSSVPGCAILKIMPVPFAPTTATDNQFGIINPSAISLAFTSMTNTDFRTIGSMLARIADSWIDPVMTVPSGNVVHDSEFLTLWANLPYSGNGIDGVLRRGPTASGSDGNINYSAASNRIDGAIYGLVNIYDNVANAFNPNMIECFTIRSGYGQTRFTNRVSYVNTSVKSGFFPAHDYFGAAITRGETYINTGTSILSNIIFGYELAQGVNIGSVSETAYELFEWCLNFEQLKSSSNRPNSGSKPKFDRNKRKNFKSADEQELK